MLRMERKILSLFLAISVIVTLFLGFAPASAENDGNNYPIMYGAIEGVTPVLNVDFETQNHGVGTQFYGGMFVGKVEENAKYGLKTSGVFTITDGTLFTNNSAFINPLPQLNYQTNTYYDSRYITAEADLYSENTNVPLNFSVYYKYNNVATAVAYNINLRKDGTSGNAIFVNGKNVMPFTEKQWYKIALSFDTEENTISTYVNGKLLKSEKILDGEVERDIISVGGRFRIGGGTYTSVETEDGWTIADTQKNSFKAVDNMRLYAAAYNPEDDLPEIDLSLVESDGEKIFFASDSLPMTMAEFKEIVGNVTVYADDTYTKTLTESEELTESSRVVAKSANGEVYAVYKVVVPSKFTYNVSSEGTAYITGYNADILTTEELKNLVIPEAVGGNNEYPVVSVDGFENNTVIETLTLPDCVNEIGASAFYNCTKLKKVTAKGLQKINAQAFRQSGVSMFNSKKEGVVILPTTLTTLGDAAFRVCHSVKDVILPASLSNVGKSAFYRSNGLESFYFPAGMTMSADAYYHLYDGYVGLDDVVIYAEKNAEVFNYVDDPKAADIYQPLDNSGVSDGNMLYDNIVTINGDIHLIEESYTNARELPINGTCKNIGETDVNFEGYAYNTSAQKRDFNVVLTVKSGDNMLKAVNITEASIDAYSAGVISANVELDEEDAIADGDEIRVILLDSIAALRPVGSTYSGLTVDADVLEYDVMAIGNSFAQDSMIHLKSIAAEDGIIINSFDCFIGGQSLSGHYQRLIADDSKYEILPDGVSTGIKTSIKNMLTYRDWDFVLLQGTTHDVAFDTSLWNNDTRAWTTLTEAVATLAPNAKRYVHATWAPYSEQAARVQSANPTYIPDDENLDARGDYTKALIPHQEFGAEIFSTEARYDNSGKKAYVPTMVAVDYAIRHFGFDEHTGTLTSSSANSTNKHWDNVTTTGIYRDTTCHLTSYVGRVLAGFVWYEMLTGNDVRENPYTNKLLTDEQIANLKEAAHYACTNYATYDPALVSAN